MRVGKEVIWREERVSALRKEVEIEREREI